jgi:stage V sporulation protein B
MIKDKFLKNSIVLTLTNSTTGVLRFVFSIILSRELGAEGLGLFSLIMPIYDLFACLICGGMVTSISKQTSEFHSKKDMRNIHRTIKVTLLFDSLWSLVIIAFLFLNSNYISLKIIKDSRSLQSIWYICPALLFVALSSIIKGYFYGTYDVKTPAIIDIFEKSLRIAAVIFVIEFFSLQGIENTVTAVYIALACGEILSFILLYITYKYKKAKDNINNFSNHINESNSQLLFNILIMSIPLSINGFLSTGISTVSTLILPRRLVLAGFDHGSALAIIGKFSGMALTIVYFPLVVVTSMAIVLIPEISENITNKDYYTLEKRLNGVLRISLLLGLSTMAICIGMPKDLGNLFYGRTDLTTYIVFAALSAPFTYLSATSFSILNGLGKQGVLLKNSILMSIQELILLYILTSIPSINILGYGITLIVTSLTTYIMNLKEIRKKCNIEMNFKEVLIYFLVTIIIFLFTNIFSIVIPDLYFKAKTISLILVGFALYFSLTTILTKNITRQDF